MCPDDLELGRLQSHHLVWWLQAIVVVCLHTFAYRSASLTEKHSQANMSGTVTVSVCADCMSPLTGELAAELAADSLADSSQSETESAGSCFCRGTAKQRAEDVSRMKRTPLS